MVYAYQRRGLTRNVQILDANSNVIVPTGLDTIRAIIGREGQLGANLETALLVVASGSDTPAGSFFRKNDPSNGNNLLRLDASDLNFAPGTYTLFIELLDVADDSEWKNVSRDVFVLEGT